MKTRKRRRHFRAPIYEFSDTARKACGGKPIARDEIATRLTEDKRLVTCRRCPRSYWWKYDRNFALPPLRERRP